MNIEKKKKKKKKKKKRIADAGTRTLALPTRRPVVLPLRYFGMLTQVETKHK